MSKISILGAGAWGTAIAILLGNNGHEVVLWSALKSEVEQLTADRELKDKLPGIKLPDSVSISGDLKSSCENKDLIVFAVASPYVRATAKNASSFIAKDQIIVNVGKGIEENTLETLTDILKDEIPQADVAVLSGPSHAEEVSRGIPTTCVVGADSKDTAHFIQDVFMTERFRVYTSPDVIGIELGGSIKNVIALAAGMADGLGFGDNTKAALMTRGIAEISRLGIAMGGKMETFAGLSGVGDLIVTCTSKHSRNRNAGYLIGQGYTMEEAMKEVKQVVEGVYSAKAALALAKKYEVEMPIVEQVNQILFEDKPALEAVSDLLLRDKRREYSELQWKK
ncbi:NAD(P)H-dependent glycerol-3-phosphate dehydrogenase [Anaerocolumna xylanovorans]|uniref:Glycerol-3-phosphate dehydrogenase [NAD(P)+] n=1 Tax=Anaerocolumna xylanovorans DSM 12503 TaxID=1121345 RepID=A0A1M7Y2R7_9FIRM|nr:NAD(P)H-dependent glycerol-3-phosphate dehydrogenase [Anaerocolumna xylanovorans]SHO46038.1 glycerol 3-phosphate dehydrogenase (NAD(P)+) [Anaerocolumna xylanovorans DSM 12503]